MVSVSLITRISRYKPSCPRAVPVTDLACVTRHLTVVHRASRVTVLATKGHWSEGVEGRRPTIVHYIKDFKGNVDFGEPVGRTGEGRSVAAAAAAGTRDRTSEGWHRVTGWKKRYTWKRERKGRGKNGQVQI